MRVGTAVTQALVVFYSILLTALLSRRPRKHPLVQLALQRLLKCIDWQPTSGPLFTAQTPMFCVFIAGIVAFRPEDRAVIDKWFQLPSEDSRGVSPCPICKSSGCNFFRGIRIALTAYSSHRTYLQLGERCGKSGLLRIDRTRR